jgi:PTH1 family peptidyl-tRNA hydrolase
MYLIIGLGNPGNKYEFTRHNIGFLVADKFVESCQSMFRPGKGDYWLANCSLKNINVTVLKPSTYMNDSGLAVKEYCEITQTPLSNILVISDDYQLPLGAIRIRPDGSDGGHNGLASVIYHLQTDQFARLRCGIGTTAMHHEHLSMKEFVLTEFVESEKKQVSGMIERAKDTCISFILRGIVQTMNQFNSTPLEEIS